MLSDGQTDEGFFYCSNGLIEHLGSLGGDAVRVFLWMLRYARKKSDHKGQVRGTVRFMAEECHMDRCACWRGICRLQEMGFVSVLVLAKNQHAETTWIIKNYKGVRDDFPQAYGSRRRRKSDEKESSCCLTDETPHETAHETPHETPHETALRQHRDSIETAGPNNGDLPASFAREETKPEKPEKPEKNTEPKPCPPKASTRTDWKAKYQTAYESLPDAVRALIDRCMPMWREVRGWSWERAEEIARQWAKLPASQVMAGLKQYADPRVTASGAQLDSWLSCGKPMGYAHAIVLGASAGGIRSSNGNGNGGTHSGRRPIPKFECSASSRAHPYFLHDATGDYCPSCSGWLNDCRLRERKPYNGEEVHND